MTLRRYLISMGITTLICWGAFIMVLFQIDPYTGGVIGLVLFFVSLFFSLWGTMSILGFGIRYIFLRNVVPFKYIGTSLRQALWFAILLCLTLFLVSQQLLEWWMSLLLVGGLTVLEGFFLARSLESRAKKAKKRSSGSRHSRTTVEKRTHKNEEENEQPENKDASKKKEKNKKEKEKTEKKDKSSKSEQ